MLRTIVIAQMKAALAQVKLVSFGMDFAKAEHQELPSGEPYVLIPTETVMDTADGKSTAKSHTLALLDGGAWYLLRVSEAPAGVDPASSLPRVRRSRIPGQLIGGLKE